MKVFQGPTRRELEQALQSVGESSAPPLPEHSAPISHHLFLRWRDFFCSFGQYKEVDNAFAGVSPSVIIRWKGICTIGKVRYSLDASPHLGYGWIEALDRRTGIKSVYTATWESSFPRVSPYVDLCAWQIELVADWNAQKLLKGKIRPEFEQEAVEEIEASLEHVDLSNICHRYGEHKILHKLKWWRLIHRGELTAPQKGSES